MSTKSNIKKIDAINIKIDDFRKKFTNRYDEANKGHNAYIDNLVERFYAKPSNANKIYKGKEKSEFDMNTSTILAPYLIQWEALINEYKKITGQEYKKPILYNAGKEAALKANQLEKEKAREARDALIAQKEAEKAKAKPVAKVKPPKNTGYAEAKKLYNKPPAPLEEINIPTVKVQVKSNNKLFSDMKDLVNTIIESQSNIKGMQPQKSEEITQLKSIKQKLNKIPKNVIITPIEEIKEDKKAKRKVVRAEKKANLPELQPWYPEEHGNRDRTGKLMSDEEIAQLRRIREKLKQSKIPENVIVSPIQEIKEEIKEVKRKRGRPIVQGSKRQAKLASTEPVIPKRRGRPPKKVIIEETKEETKQEESKEDVAPKRKRGRPVVQGSKRQAKLAEPKKPRGRPKKTEESKNENVEPKQSKAGRPSKCSSVPPKSNIIETNTFNRPIIEWIDIDKKFKLNSSQIVSPLLLKYSKINKDLFFDIIEILLKNRLSAKVKREITKSPTKQELFIIFKKICAFAIYYGFTTAYEIENALILRITGDLQTDPKALKRFMGFLKKNCIGKQGEAIKAKAKSVAKPKKDKVYKENELTNFYDVPIEGKVLKDSSISFGDIVAGVFTGKNKSIRLNDKEKIEIIDWEMDDEGEELTTKTWREVNGNKMLMKGLIRRILDALKEVSPDNYEELNKLYKEEPEYVFENIIDYLA